jgi:hypothetical protein
MAVVKIEGKEITLPDDVVKAGDKAIRAVLAANGFPAVENADIQIVGGKQGAPAIVNVSPRSTGKGAPADHFLEKLAAAPEYVNPAIALAAAVWQAEAQGDTDFVERATRSGEVERAIEAGSREGREVIRALRDLGHVTPCSSKKVPIGF